jgi:hypothetical protein
MLGLEDILAGNLKASKVGLGIFVGFHDFGIELLSHG